MRTLLIWTALVAGLAASAWALSSATAPDTGPLRYHSNDSSFVISRPHLREIALTGVRLVAESRAARYEPGTEAIFADQIHGFALRDGGRTELWAATGKYQVNTTTATLSGGVHMRNDAGYSFQTTAAEYRHDVRRLSAAGDFTADGNGLKLRGRGLDYDIPGDSFNVRENVGAEIQRFRL